jgi:uncharacterized protein YndB with AHSA1/START domain/DNA-binding transcriptional ArsR family regulator
VEDDAVFKALADASRRKILDILFAEDGQTQADISSRFAMTRYGVMKHLVVLEEAGLIVTRREGREKKHYLNPVPIRLVYERWVDKFASGWSGMLTGFKRDIESRYQEEQMATHVQMMYIKADVTAVWQALTDPDMTRRYYFGSIVESDWRAGAAYRYRSPDGEDLITGTVVEIDPPRHLVTTFLPHWEGAEDAQASRVSFELESVGDATKLTVIHENIDPASELGAEFVEGWAKILSGLKSLLETGEAL